jgi:hypothetical protein
LRDSSHVRSLSLAELRELFAFCGLVKPQPDLYELHVGLEELLARAVPDPGDLAEIRATDIAYRATILLAERSAR